MINIIPNWHPIWVHFTIGLLIIGTLFYALAWIGRERSWANSLLAAARWNLTVGIAFALTAFLSGFLAAGSVAHDDAAHANILVHRNWALTAVLIFIVAGIWVWAQWRKAAKRASVPVVLLLLAGSAALAVTGFEGGQNVFEYGLGVQKLPDVGHHDHHHQHGITDAHDETDGPNNEDVHHETESESQEPETDSHNHEHGSSGGHDHHH